jgi:putative heme-binding domain-containing protein
VRALAAVGARVGASPADSERAASLALHVVDHPRDDALDYAVWLAARELQGAWLPAVLAGSFDDGGKIARVLFAIRAAETTAASGWMIDRWTSGAVTGTELDMLIDAIALLGDAGQQQAVFGFVSNPATPAVRAATVLGQQGEAHRKRRVVPEGDLKELARLVASSEPTLAAAAIDAAGAWQVAEAAAGLGQIAADPGRELAIRQGAIRALGNLPGTAAHESLARVAGAAATPEPVLAAALSALVGRSLDDASTLTAAWLATGPGDAAIHEVLRAFLGARGAADRLAQALATTRLAPSTARTALQDVTAAGRPEPGLTAVLEGDAAAAGGRAKTAEERAWILARVGTGADAGRGSELYRREALRCVACHRIDREGGRVGPNLTAIGSAAQPDYLLESLLDPAKNVKEGYGALVVVTADGQVTSGIPVSRSDTELVLRNALDKEVRLQLADIDEEAPGTSLMPAGLVDGLSKEEIADLVRYLSSLGR